MVTYKHKKYNIEEKKLWGGSWFKGFFSKRSSSKKNKKKSSTKSNKLDPNDKICVSNTPMLNHSNAELFCPSCCNLNGGWSGSWANKGANGSSFNVACRCNSKDIQLSLSYDNNSAIQKIKRREASPSEIKEYLIRNPDYSSNFLKKLELRENQQQIELNVLQNLDLFLEVTPLEIWEEDISESYDNMWMEVLDDIDSNYDYMLDQFSGDLISSKFYEIWWDYHYSLLKELNLKTENKKTGRSCQDNPENSYFCYIYVPDNRHSEIKKTIREKIKTLEKKIKEFSSKRSLKKSMKRSTSLRKKSSRNSLKKYSSKKVIADNKLINLCLHGKNESEKKKYCNRPSPPYSASDCPEGYLQKGNDKRMYIIKKNKKGVHQWKVNN